MSRRVQLAQSTVVGRPSTIAIIRRENTTDRGRTRFPPSRHKGVSEFFLRQRHFGGSSDRCAQAIQSRVRFI